MTLLLTSGTSLLLLLLLAHPSCSSPLLLDGGAAHHRWDGHGGLSAGASSRLLWDYPEPQRSDILDFLYKPQHGASLKVCKIEIGGDVMSTDGTEPSHMHSREDLSCDRGYELWIAEQALARNPSVKTYALSWGTPGWVGNESYFSEDNYLYQVKFVSCFRNRTGVDLNYLGIWNEREWGGVDYVLGLRNALDAAGHSATRILLPDNRAATYDPAIIALLSSNASFNAAVAGIGIHGEVTPPEPDIERLNHTYWISEAATRPISATDSWAAASDWARLLSRPYIMANITGAICWATIWSVLPGLPYAGRGFMVAQTPWSGAYEVSLPIWASSHWGQFLEVGWRHLLVGRGAGILLDSAGSDAGSYVAYVPPSGRGLTLVIETTGKAAPPGLTVFQLQGGLPGPGSVLAVWQTTAEAPFMQMPSATVAADGTLSLQLPADGILTVSSVTTAAHGTPTAPIPPPAPLALPFTSDFSGAYDSLPRYLSDQGGSFAVRGGYLTQTAVGRPGRNDWIRAGSPDPITLLGDTTPWSAINISVSDVTFSSSSTTPPLPAEDLYVRVCAHVTAYSGFNGPAPVPGYCLGIDSTGAWGVSAGAGSLGRGQLSTFDSMLPHALALWTATGAVTASIDGVQLGSWASSAFDGGMVAFGSGCHPAQVGGLRVARTGA